MGPSRLGDYELGDLVGFGGVGQVYAARDQYGRSVVVKRLRESLSRDTRMRQRLGDEGRVCRQVSHPNVIRMFEDGNDSDGAPFIVMDRARGITLRELVDDVGPLPIERIRVLVLQLLDGLAASHAAGIVHADLNSNNIIIDTLDGADHLTIIDFGLARTNASQAFDDGLVAGTPEFMAPELFGGAHPAVSSDIYAVGIIIYEMLVGTTPFCGAPAMQILQRQMTEAVTLPQASRALISPELERVLMCALDRNVPYRFQDVRKLARAFDEATRSLVPESFILRSHTRSHAPPITVCDVMPIVVEDPAIDRWRGDLLGALEGPDPDPIIVAYLGLANALIKSRRMLEAIQELEDGLAILSPHTGTPPGPLWRIALLLAAMYARQGNHVRGRRYAMDAHDHATRVGDADGIDRTRKLLRRLAGAHGTIKPETELAETVHTRQTIRFPK